MVFLFSYFKEIQTTKEKQIISSSRNTIGIIGGSGFYSFLNDPLREEIATPFGNTVLFSETIENREIFFLNRHGSGHSVPPHSINYKANIYALWKKGVDFIVSTTAVGVLKDYEPGDVILLDQFVDFVSPPITYFDGKFSLTKLSGEKKEGVIHTDFSEPYCPLLRKVINKLGSKHNIFIKNGGIYILTRGPRFETPAEIAIMARNNWGNVVGMTNPNEVILARELEMHYSTIAIATNFAAGISASPITHLEVLDIFNNVKPKLEVLLKDLIISEDLNESCNCIIYPK